MFCQFLCICGAEQGAMWITQSQLEYSRCFQVLDRDQNVVVCTWNCLKKPQSAATVRAIDQSVTGHQSNTVSAVDVEEPHTSEH